MDSTIRQGLYLPQLERDSCGVGMIAQIKGAASRYVVDSALTMLENMEHRGACGCDENTGDGAGILVQIPHEYLESQLRERAIELPRLGKYGVGQVFLPQDPILSAYCDHKIEEWSSLLDFELIAKREVSVNDDDLGPSAIATQPKIVQYFFKTTGFNYKDMEHRLYILRNSILKDIYFSREELRDDFYICSLSSRTIVYKGMLKAVQLRHYFDDLQDPKFQSAVAIVHSRFSTNTTPKWKLAQPFRCIAHNGEINTIQSNLNWWNARERFLKKTGSDNLDLAKVFPVCDPFISDSGNFDNVVDFLLRASRSIPHSIMMMIPEAWQNQRDIDEHKRAFYQYHDAIMEPWDGPASICFTDGVVLGATLDRNGLRPSRYLVTKDDHLVVSSEAGSLNIDEAKIMQKGRLEPGKILVADLEEGRIISDKEVKDTICRRRPYQTWLQEHSVHISELDHSTALLETDLTSYEMKRAVGMTREDYELIMQTMMTDGKEPIHSMGADVPLAVLSSFPQHVSHYFKQQFAQVTNPPIDPIREAYYMSLKTSIGVGSRFLNVGTEEAKTVRLDSPILASSDFAALSGEAPLPILTQAELSLSYSPEMSLEAALTSICAKASEYHQNGINTLILSQRRLPETHLMMPSLLAVGALHQSMIQSGYRKELSLIVDACDVWEGHHMACLLSFGADLIYPRLAMQCADETDNPEAAAQYLRAAELSLLKIMSKLGISTVNSYRGAQSFEIVGLAPEVIEKCFTGAISRIQGLGFEELDRENRQKQLASDTDAYADDILRLEDRGLFRWTRKGEYHLFNPKTIHLLQHSTKMNDYEIYKKFAEQIDLLEYSHGSLRSFLDIRPTGSPIDIEEVESAEAIMKRFATGAMSFGSLSEEAHKMLALAMNRIGGKSNSGEGGEDPARYIRDDQGRSTRSAIKQVASGRFGVDIEYLNQADEIQIKIAQGAKPGEGGQLPGHKVDEHIARVRRSTPGVGLISPPPHHDIYSIEDLAQLIFDLKNANRRARISVKLVSKSGIGVIASGVVKAHADHILVSGSDGGTGASPLGSIRHAGLPWEIGLSETHQTLMRSGLRDRTVLQADGQLRTGRDLAIATMLGAEEWGIATAALVVEGCILMRKCHLNTCPVGIATQDPALRKNFSGKVDHLVNYFRFLAEHLREIMAACGVKKVDDLLGRTDLLTTRGLHRHWKTEKLDLAPLLYREEARTTTYCSRLQDHGIDQVLDKKLLYFTEPARKGSHTYRGEFPIINTDRAIGTMLSSEIVRNHGLKGLAPELLQLHFTGSAGQSFGAFAVQGLRLSISGEANDYFGKGLSGACLAVRPSVHLHESASEHTIIGNVALYGATAGEAYIAGLAGDRFAVRNSGALAVVEGVGDNACEYMTGGRVLILGRHGRNLAAGMSGGILYLHEDLCDPALINQKMVLIEDLQEPDRQEIDRMLKRHIELTASTLAQRLLDRWEKTGSGFVRIIPKEYKRLTEQSPAISHLKVA